MIDQLNELYSKAINAAELFRLYGDQYYIDQVIFDMRSVIIYLRGLQKEVINSIKDEDSFGVISVKQDKLYAYNSHIKDLEQQIKNLEDLLHNPS